MGRDGQRLIGRWACEGQKWEAGSCYSSTSNERAPAILILVLHRAVRKVAGLNIAGRLSRKDESRVSHGHWSSNTNYSNTGNTSPTTPASPPAAAASEAVPITAAAAARPKNIAQACNAAVYRLIYLPSPLPNSPLSAFIAH